MTITIDASVASEIREALRYSAYLLESNAHLRRMERQLLPAAEENRRVMEYLTTQAAEDEFLSVDDEACLAHRMIV